MAEFTIPPNLIYQLSQEMLSFARKYGIAKIVSVGGLASQRPSNKIYVVSSDSGISKTATNLGIMPVEDGMVAGVSASLLTYSKDYGIPMMDILVEVNPGIMDPKYAELAITGLNKLLAIDVDLSELRKEAKLVEAKIREMLKKVKEHQQQMGSGTGAGAGEPPAPNDQSMYA
jgi:predicted ATP-grasp superfamily ATP-dependent carboligase